ncbi:hypothetical protein CC78DRAFT_549542 [Lojkania enalia]|uniref:DUF7924 domain-containing protein n=1 Tax=Lojkania enalia TaxID=147567 RepID=A0A9P4MXV7_9PLEO|nr:hypothetical protein CC78DRAFT_549542 [Didymosphaeria enalia]
MKRLLEGVESTELLEDSAHHCKRRKPEHTSDSSLDILNCAFECDQTNTPALTQQTLEKLDVASKSESVEDYGVSCRQSVEQWADKCKTEDKIEMPPSPTPSSLSWRGNRRRTAKLAQRQRSSSPVKKANNPQYRAMNMADANLFVDHLPEAPAEVETQLRRVFGDTTLLAKHKRAIDRLAIQYCEESRVLAKKCAGENEWRSHLFLGLLQPLERLEPDTLMLSASEKPWNPELKPTAPSPFDFDPRPTSTSHSHNDVQPLDVDTVPPRAPSAASTFPNTPIFSAPSTAPSDISSENPNGLSTPKPDITLGLAHTNFTPIQKSVLMQLQDESHVQSEPHQVQIGLRFPFLVVESKGGAGGGNMIGAQNQAAVDGACALNILGDLEQVVAHMRSRACHGDLAHGEIRGNQETVYKVPMIVFSVTSEGPLYEIWVHYRVSETYHMTCHRAWRTTRREDADEFVRALAGIVEWGRRGFRDNVFSSLGHIEQAMRRGVPLRIEEVYSNERG